MAGSAYELMMVLRGRNYLSSDLRRAGADIGRLRTASTIQASQTALKLQQQRLALQYRGYQQTLQGSAGELANLRIQQRAMRMSQSEAAALNRISGLITQQAQLETQKLVNRREQLAIERQIAIAMKSQNLAYKGTPLAELQLGQQAAVSRQIDLQNRSADVQRNLLTAQAAVTESASQNAKVLAESYNVLGEKFVVAGEKAKILDEAYMGLNARQAELDQEIREAPYEKLSAQGRYVQHLGRAFQTFGIVSTAALGYTAYAAAKFNTQMTLVSTQLTDANNRTTASILKTRDAVSQSLMNMLMTGQTPFKPDELSNALYTISSGVTFSGNQQQQIRSAVDVLKEFNRVAIANYGQVEFNDVTRAGVALINSFNLSGKQIPVVMNRAQASVRYGAMSMGQFVESLNQTLPAYRAAHYSFNQLAADTAAISRLFPNLRFGTTGLARMIETLGKDATIQGLRQQLHINIAPGGRLLPVLTILQMIAKARPELTKGSVAAQNFFKAISGSTSTVQARRAFSQLISHLGLYSTISHQVITDNQELSKSFTDMSQTQQVRWAEFTNQMRGIVLIIGTGAAKAFGDLAKAIRPIITWFSSLSGHTKNLIGEIAAFTAMAVALSGTVLVFGGALARLYSAYKLFAIGRELTAAGGIAGIASKMAGVEEAAAAAGGGVAALGAEAGSIAVSGALMLGIPAAIFLMIKYHQQTMQVINALGGLKAVLFAITVAITAGGLAKIAPTLIEIGQAAIAASAEVGALDLAMAGLGANIPMLVALAAALAGLLAYDVFAHRRRMAQVGQQGIYSKVFVDDTGRLSRQITSSMRGPVNRTSELTDKQAQHLGLSEKQLNIDRLDLGNKKEEAIRMGNIVSMTIAENKALAAQNELKSRNHKLDQSAHVTAKTLSRSVQQWIANVEAAKKAAALAPRDLSKQKAYEQILANMNKRFKDQPVLLAAINDVLSAYDQNLQKSTTSAQKLVATQQDVMSGLQSMYDQILQQNEQAYGQLFQGPYIQSPIVQNRLQWGGMLTGEDLIKDQRSQLRQFTKFTNEINTLRRRGAPEEFIKQLREAYASDPTNTLQRIHALLTLSGGQLTGYFKMFQKAQAYIHTQTMNQLTEQLQDYKKYGKKVGAAMVAGIQSETPAVVAALKSIINKMFPGLPVDSTVNGTGGGGGRHRRHPPDHQRRAPQTVNNNTTNNYHIHGGGTLDPGIATQIRHAQFRERNRQRGKVHQWETGPKHQ